MRVWVTALAATTILVADAAGQSASTSPTATGAQIYAAACAGCHGKDGTGTPQSQLGFPEEVPDFTDCSFASPETAQDWSAIVHQGGPVRAFSRRMPRFGVALTKDQIDRVVDYVRSLCTDKRWPQGELNFPRPMVTEKAFPENETVFTSQGVTRKGSRSAEAAVVYERRFGPRNQLELELPLATMERAAADGGGWFGPRPADAAIALKTVLYHSDAGGRILSLLNEVVVPTGSQRLGFGSGTPVYEPTLLAGQLFPANFFIQLQTGVEIPFDDKKAEREALLRTAFGTTVGSAYGRAWSPMVELVGARELESGVKTEWDLVPQMQVTLSRRQHIAFALGLRLPLTEKADRPRTLMAYLLWDWFDGGFFDGWR